jgi:hypothetical protein
MFKKRSDTEKQLAEAKSRLKKAIAALAPKHQGGEWDEFNAAQSELLRLERALAKERNEPYAVPCDFPVRWDVGAPLPFLLQNDNRTFLTFYVREPDPNWDGTNVTVVDPSSPSTASLCLVEFQSTSTKFGHPNDEVHGGHPLYGRGLESYTAQIVKNSPWVKEVAKTNSVHHCDRPERWDKMNHYVFWFHDSTFECLAESYTVELCNESMADLLTRVQAKLLK